MNFSIENVGNANLRIKRADIAELHLRERLNLFKRNKVNNIKASNSNKIIIYLDSAIIKIN